MEIKKAPQRAQMDQQLCGNSSYVTKKENREKNIYRSGSENIKICKAIFAIFDCLWPNLWSKQFNTEESNILNSSKQNTLKKIKINSILKCWSNIIQRLSDEDINMGVNKIKNGQSIFISYPPNPLQFYKFCNSQTIKNNDRSTLIEDKLTHKEWLDKIMNRFQLSKDDARVRSIKNILGL